MAESRLEQSNGWQLVEEVFCADGNNDRAIRDFESRRRDLAAHPKRLRIDILCHRDTGASTVRFLWNPVEPEQLSRRKPRSPKPTSE
jgi:hypothetical protein